MIGTAIKLFLGQHWIAVGAVITFAGIVWGWDSSRKSAWFENGSAAATAKIEKATSNAASKGSAAARKSLAGGVRAQRDPTTRDD